jgi:hypothetical protein
VREVARLFGASHQNRPKPAIVTPFPVFVFRLIAVKQALTIWVAADFVQWVCRQTWLMS